MESECFQTKSLLHFLISTFYYSLILWYNHYNFNESGLIYYSELNKRKQLISCCFLQVNHENMKGNVMIYKVFYQETKERSPRREKTRALYLEVEAANELEGRIQARKLIEENTPYNIEFIELLSDKHLEYEKESGTFELTEF